MALPRTPKKSSDGLHEIVRLINDQFCLDLPNPLHYSPSVHRNPNSLGWRSYASIKRLYFGNFDLNGIINDFEDWIYSRQVPTRDRGKGTGGMTISAHERDERLRYLVKLLDDGLYLLNGGNNVSFARRNGNGNVSREMGSRSPLKRRLSEEEDDEFHTAPNSPVKNIDPGRLDQLDIDKSRATLDHSVFRLDSGTTHVAKSPKLSPGKGPSKFVEKLTTPEPPRHDAVDSKLDVPRFSFSTATTSFLGDSRSTVVDSFTTEVTEPDNESQYEDSIVGHLLSQEARVSFETEVAPPPDKMQRSTDQVIIDELVQRGPFSIQQSFPPSVPLRYRYELERIGRAWDVPFDRMLAGNNISFSWQDFWKWIERHNQRGGKPLPEKSSRAVWEAAIGEYKADRHSEVVVFTGDLDWCSPSEPGIMKLKLNPLRTEKSCRFRRRFGSDRFMSLTMPAPARPPKYLRLPSQPTVLRESVAAWLTQNVHRCMGRAWRPFFVEQVKGKRKSSEPKFKIEFFAIDGDDFTHNPAAPSIAPPKQSCDRHTPMTLESFIEWHMPRDANINQSDCKLFQRFSLGLSKTFATVVLKPTQVVLLKDDPDTPVMNDGCALISRSLANAICDSLGISGNTPSCFQGRIAGAKGLWMVDRHQSEVSAAEDSWIQISDSQLKIKPHPHLWKDPIDSDQLTFEVVKWSKPLHPVDLNVQLLGILEYGGGHRVKEYVSELTRAGIQALYQDFTNTIQSNSHILCRSLVQRMRPAAEEPVANKVRSLDQWMMNPAECIVRLTEAGFGPRSFYPLRKRLGKCLSTLLDRYVEQLHIEVPLSTYAFCIADPYGVLDEDEVHFGFSANWHDPEGNFEDNLLDGFDVLVGRLPAHLPSDIQRRRAVWKPELRHFKDVIVFPTKGDVPLAHMLSGGDYDGDTPWICWDQNIVMNFRNSDLPSESYPPDYFGLTEHSISMRDVPINDFLRNVFTFNLTLSNLGRCTAEHERISYDESIDSSKAKELACLLSHLVDGRKGGVHLSELAWQKYRKTISPVARGLPAYRNPMGKFKRTNIIDYLKFEVAEQEKRAVLTKLQKEYPESESLDNIDQDLARPWNEAYEMAKEEGKGGQLHNILAEITKAIKELNRKWATSISKEEDYSPVAKEATDSVKTIRPPTGNHPIIHTWQNSEDEWQRLLASCTYRQHHHGGFAIQAFGETLCQIKAGGLPARAVVHDVLACYKINQKSIRQVMAKELDEEDEFEGEDAVEAALYGGGLSVPGAYYDPDDGMSVE